MSPVPVPRILLLFLAGAFLGVQPAPAAAGYDMDCAIILCMAAGFPAEPSGTCGAAYDAMLDRITDFPPKPPFGACSTGDGGTYEPSGVSMLQPGRQSPGGWACDEDAVLLFDEIADYGRAAPACHPAADMVASTIPGRPPYLQHPTLSEPAERVAYRIQLTLPAGAKGESWVSPLLLGNPATGFTRSLDPTVVPPLVLILSGQVP